MTDQEKVANLFTELGLPTQVFADVDGTDIRLEVQSPKNEKVAGYSGFVCDFCFDMQGQFKKVVIAE